MRWLISGVAGAACAGGVAAGVAASVEVVCAQTTVVLAQKRHNPSRATVTRENRFMMARPLSPRSLAPLRESVRFRVSEANFSDARAKCLTHISHSGYRKMPSNNVYRGHKESLLVLTSILSFHWLRPRESRSLQRSNYARLPRLEEFAARSPPKASAFANFSFAKNLLSSPCANPSFALASTLKAVLRRW